MLKIAVIAPIPTPYRDSFWNEFAQTPGVDLTVYYCSGGKPDRPWTVNWPREYRHEVLPGRNLMWFRGADASCFWNPKIGRCLKSARFDAVLIDGYNHPTMGAAMWCAVQQKIPFYLMCESHLRGRRSNWKQRIKGPLLRAIVGRAAGFLPTGQLAAEYLTQYGASPAAMTAFPNVPDVERYQAQVLEHRQRGNPPFNDIVQGRPVILFVGRLIPKKRADLLVRAFHAVHSQTDALLVIVGDGPMRSELEQLTARLDLSARVHFAGFVQPDEVLRWYARANLFVLPSSETWGASAVEALAAGVTVIVSDETGCYPDVVTNPIVGAVVRAGNLDALAAALEQRLQGRTTHEDVDLAWSGVRQKMRFDVLSRALVRAIEGSAANSFSTARA